MRLFKNKKVAVLGLSTEGQDAVSFFVSQGSKVFCFDRRTKEELGSEYKKLTLFPVTFKLGPGYLEDLKNYDLLVRSPGMALFLPELKVAQARGQEITSLTKLFFDLCPSPIIGITGTKGKGTTTTMIGEMLKASGKTVHVGGNVGKALLSHLSSIVPADSVVLELSSFQLEDLEKSPHIAIVLNITSDHFANADPLASNFHKSRTDYVNAKKNIVAHQTRKDFAILNGDYETSKSFSSLTSGTVYLFSKKNEVKGIFIKDNTIVINVNKKISEICKTADIRLRGSHNQENVMAASLAAYIGGADILSIRKIIKTFKGLEHRLEEVVTVEGVTYFNDSFSTTPETSIAAIAAFSQQIILIAGGSEKGADFTELGKEIVKNNVKTLILIGEMANRIHVAVQKTLKTHPKKIEIITGLTTMEEMIAATHKNARPGDIVLLSPACASFGLFKNYKERGNLFKHYAQALA